MAMKYTLRSSRRVSQCDAWHAEIRYGELLQIDSFEVPMSKRILDS